MKKILHNLFLLMLGSLLTGQVYAQCTNSTAPYITANAPTTLNAPFTINTCHYLNEYTTLNAFQVGGVYEITMTSTTTAAAYITVMTGAAGTGTVVAHGPSPLIFVATATTLYPHWNSDASCGQVSGNCETGTIEFTAAPATCIQPISLTASNFTTTSADLAWSDVNATAAMNYDIELVPGGGATTGIPTQSGVTNPYTYNGLTPGFTYDYYVRGHCSATDTSAWAGPFQFTTLATCQAPSNLTVTNITASSVDLSWTENNTPASTTWDIAFLPAGSPFTGTPTFPNITSNPYTQPGLPPNFGFDCYVRSQCAGNSSWTGPITFTTLCLNATVNATTPYCEDFTTAPSCWSESGSNNYVVDTFGYAHASFWSFNAPAQWIYTTHLIELDAAMLPQLSFDWSHLHNTTYVNDAFDVEITNDGGVTWTNILNLSGASFTTPGAQNQAPAPLPWSNTIVPLTAYAGDTVMLRYTASSGWGPDLYLDNICIEQQPSCVDPVSLAATPAAMTAALSWTDNNVTAPMGWMIMNQTVPGTAPTGGAGVYQAGAAPNYNATGLTPVTNYEFYVRAVCAVGDSSAWVGPFAYTTTPTCVAPTAGTAAPTPTAATLTWTDNNVSPPMGWMIDQDTSGVALGAGVYQLGGTPTFSVSGLTPNSVYRFYVRAVCSAGDSSAWAGPFTYQTPCLPTPPPSCEDFATMGFNSPPSCWTLAGGGTPVTGPTNIGTSIWTNRNFANLGTNQGASINLFQSGNNHWIISPQYDMSATGGPFRAEYDFGIWEYFSNTPGTLGSDDVIQLLISSDGGATWTNLKTWDSSSVTPAAGIREVVNLSAYTTGTVMFAFHGTDGTVQDLNDNDIMVDNFCVVPIPSCNQPYALSATNITAISADLDWSDSNTAPLGWDIEVVPQGNAPTGIGIFSATKPFSATGLTHSSCFDYYVRTACAVGDSSLWTGPYNFCTACAADSVSVFNAKGTFTGGVLPQCWIVTEPTPTNHWRFSGTAGNPTMTSLLDHTSGTAAGAGNYAWCDGSSGQLNESYILTTNSVLNAEITAMANPLLSYYLSAFNVNGNPVNTLINNCEFKCEVSYDGGTSYVEATYLRSNLIANDWVRYAVEIDKTALGTNDLFVRFVFNTLNTSAFGVPFSYLNDHVIDDVEIIDASCASLITGIATMDTTANCECTDLAGWSHYSVEGATSNELAVSVEKDTTAKNLAPTLVHIQGAATGATNVQPTAANPPGYVTTTYYYVMNRFWDVDLMDTARQPTGPTNVRFYYPTADFTALQAAVTGAGGTLATHTDMVAYKIGNGKDPDPTNGHSMVTPIDYTEFVSGPTANATDYVYSAYGTDHQMELQITSFSGGGGGFGPSNVGGALPVTLTKFVVNKEGSVSMALWTTANEVNNSHFNLQRSTDGNMFETLGKVKSKAFNGTSDIELNYTFADQSPQIGHNYYRLQQVDMDGNLTYSEIIDVVWGADGSVISIYPNPTADKLNIDLATDKIQQLEVRLVDMNGRVVKSIMQRTEKGMNNVTFSLQELSAGVYGVQIFENNVMTHISKVRKN